MNVLDWAVRVGEGQSLILKTSVLKTKESGGKGGKLLGYSSRNRSTLGLHIFLQLA